LLRNAEREVAALSEQRDALAAQLATHTAEHEALARVGTELAEVHRRLDEAEERWLALAEEAEAHGT
jgi:hypothetical protein